MKQDRVVTVDALRGLLAFGVLIYHVIAYEGGPVLIQIGRYGVYSFFAISGFALYTSYMGRIGSRIEIYSYFISRFFRIAPLYYVTLMISIIVFGSQDFSWGKLFFNITFLMGFANPGELSMVAGGWSIGIEMAFYVLFPILVLTCGGREWRLGVLAATLFVAQVIFVNRVLSDSTLAQAWNEYTQPIAFAGYFSTGCLVAGILARRPNLKGHVLAWIFTFIAVGAFALVSPGNEDAMKGAVGAFLTLSCLALVSGVTLLPEPHGKLRSLADWLGRHSYGIYLLHPIVYFYAAQTPMGWSHLPLTIAGTSLAAICTYTLIEEPALKLAKRINANRIGENIMKYNF